MGINATFVKQLALCFGMVVLVAACASSPSMTAGLNSAKSPEYSTKVVDSVLREQVKQKLNSGKSRFNDVRAFVSGAQILFIGRVGKDFDKVDLVKYARNLKYVEYVHDEIRVEEERTPKTRNRDKRLGALIRSRFTASRLVNAGNFKLGVYRGEAYISGVAKSDDELARALTIARDVNGIEKVNSYALIAERFDVIRYREDVGAD